MKLIDLIAGKPAPGSVARIAGIAVANPGEQNPVDMDSVARIAGIAVANPGEQNPVDMDSVARIAGIAVANPGEQNPVDMDSVARIAGIATPTPGKRQKEQLSPSEPLEVATAILAIPATEAPSEPLEVATAIPATEAPTASVARSEAGLHAALAEAATGLPITLAELIEAFGEEGRADWLEGYEPHCQPEFLRAFAEAVCERLARERAKAAARMAESVPNTPGSRNGLSLAREDRQYMEASNAGRN